jgi:hypothetical protein
LSISVLVISALVKLSPEHQAETVNFQFEDRPLVPAGKKTEKVLQSVGRLSQPVSPMNARSYSKPLLAQQSSLLKLPQNQKNSKSMKVFPQMMSMSEDSDTRQWGYESPSTKMEMLGAFPEFPDNLH